MGENKLGYLMDSAKMDAGPCGYGKVNISSQMNGSITL